MLSRKFREVYMPIATDRLIIGIGAAILAILITFAMPVQARRVNQRLVTLLIVVLCFAAALLLLDFPLSILVAIGASVVAILYRDVVRFVRHAIYDVTKYRRRDFWYRRVGETVLGGGRRARRRNR